MSALEERLSRLDLQLESVGAHLSDERLACVAQGSDPTASEAGHLAGCDDCTALLMAVGAGFEAALMEVPGAESWVQAPSPAPTGSSWGVLLGGGALMVSAAALWVALGTNDAVKPTPTAPARVIEAAEPTHPSPAAARVVPERSASNAPSRVPPVELTPSDGPAKAAAAVSAPVKEREAAEIKKPETRPPEATKRPEPGATAVPRGEMRVRGPRPLSARPVDGPPRGSGYLRLAAKPPAKVYLDDKFIGWTPLVDHRLIEGPHDVRLVYESDRARLKEERFRVVIEPDRIWRSLRRNLRR